MYSFCKNLSKNPLKAIVFLDSDHEILVRYTEKNIYDEKINSAYSQPGEPVGCLSFDLCTHAPFSFSTSEKKFLGHKNDNFLVMNTTAY